MMWVKIRDAANQSWMVYHHGLNGGTNPEQYKIELNSSGAETSFTCWDNTAPTATSFRVGNQVETNSNGSNFIAMLFASVDGISKVGSYSGASGGTEITTGFQPRFILTKKLTSGRNWHLFDTTRGINSSSGGSDARLLLDTNAAQFSNSDYVSLTSTGFTVNDYDTHGSGSSFIYYAHA